MLFEEAIMEILYGVQRDVEFTSAPDSSFGRDILCDDFVVGWGMPAGFVKPGFRGGIAALIDE